MSVAVAVSMPLLPAGVEPAVRTEVYDGPLDLLLVLIRKEGVEIRDVPIARICDNYLEHLNRLQEIDVDTAGDYLVLAATLCQLKARELLPRPESIPVEDEPDPREALVQRLLDYERYREAADALAARPLLDRDMFARPAQDVPISEQPVEANVDSMGLGLIYAAIMARLGKPEVVHAVEAERLSMAEAVRWLLKRLSPDAETVFAELMLALPDRRQRIFLFLSVLELARSGTVELRQVLHLGSIRLRSQKTASEINVDDLALQAVP